MAGIYWLASYPKSGNTWARAFLANYQLDNKEPVNINRLGAKLLAARRELFDDFLGLESSDLYDHEIERYRPWAAEQLAATSAAPLFVKVHDAFTYTEEGAALFPAAASRGVIYLIRNPLDVAVSYAHHDNVGLDTVIERMEDETFTLATQREGPKGQVPQRLGSWSGHVRSWVEQTVIRTLVIRYEDMVASPMTAFRTLIQFAGLPVETARIERAVRFASFDTLRQQEETFGFHERQPTAPSFFRRGKVGDWRHVLSKQQVERIVAVHGPTMRRSGYLSEEGIITC